MTSFLHNLDEDIKRGLAQRLRVEWTHHSTAIEGNSLTEGETAFVIGEGLTIAGKSLKDHQEVMGHARAIDLVMELVEANREIAEADLFVMHGAVQTGVEIDIMKPVGKWKREPNGAMVVVQERTQFNDTYALPEDVPVLMRDWTSMTNTALREAPGYTDEQALDAYLQLHAGFVRIHPFADGNGRMARLLANLPVLRSGKPPILVPRSARTQYLRTLAEWQLDLGRAMPRSPLMAAHPKLRELREIFEEGWSRSLQLVEEARATQRSRQR
ncbi:MAG: Fic family protein [Burkholderiales bacterium]